MKNLLFISFMLLFSLLAGAEEDTLFITGDQWNASKGHLDKVISLDKHFEEFPRIEKRLDARYITCYTDDYLLGLPSSGDCIALPICEDDESPFTSIVRLSILYHTGPHCREE